MTKIFDCLQRFASILFDFIRFYSILGSKQRLIENSLTFRRILSEETNLKSIKIIEKSVQSLIIVLKIGLNVQPFHQVLESIGSDASLDDCIRIANKYELFEVERQLSEHSIKSYHKITYYSDISYLIQRYNTSKDENLVYLPEMCLQMIDQNADKVMQLLDNPVVLMTISDDILTTFLSRDSFGVNEMLIYSLIKKSFEINEMVNQNLVKAIRISNLDQIFVHFTQYLPDLTDRQFSWLLSYLKNSKDRKLEKKRICRQPNVLFTTNDFESNDIRISSEVFVLKKKRAKEITFTLPIETHMNYIKFKTNCDILKTTFPSVYYYCEVCVQNKWIKVFDCTQTPCFSTQEIYFEECVVSAVRLIGMTSKDKKKSCFSLSFLNNDFLYYGLTDRPLKTKDNSIVAEESYLSESDAICFIHFVDLHTIYEFTKILFKNQIIDPNLHFSENCLETIYKIHLTQPLFVNCLEIDFWNPFEKLVIFSVKFIDRFNDLDCYDNQIRLFTDIECRNTSIKFDFEAKHMLSILIECRTEDKPIRLLNCRLYHRNH